MAGTALGGDLEVSSSILMNLHIRSLSKSPETCLSQSSSVLGVHTSGITFRISIKGVEPHLIHSSRIFPSQYVRILWWREEAYISLSTCYFNSLLLLDSISFLSSPIFPLSTHIYPNMGQSSVEKRNSI